jgi:hypothetical protein
MFVAEELVLESGLMVMDVWVQSREVIFLIHDDFYHVLLRPKFEFPDNPS